MGVCRAHRANATSTGCLSFTGCTKTPFTLIPWGNLEPKNGLWEANEVPGENTRRHGENMQITKQKGPQPITSNIVAVWQQCATALYVQGVKLFQ